METIQRISSSLPLAGRVAIVTGATRGMGRAIAFHLHSLGTRVTLNYVSSSSKAELLVSELNDPSQPKSAIAVRAYVSDPDQINNLFDQTEQEFGSNVHIVVNCAGVLDPKYPALSKITLEDFEKTFTTNTRGAFLCCKEAAKRVIRGGGGRIIMMSTSMVGGLSPGYGVYAASKAAVETMVKVEVNSELLIELCAGSDCVTQRVVFHIDDEATAPNLNDEVAFRVDEEGQVKCLTNRHGGAREMMPSQNIGMGQRCKKKTCFYPKKKKKSLLG